MNYTDTPPTIPALGLSGEEIDSFDRDGYLVLRNRVPQEMIERLSDAADDSISKGLRLHGSLEQSERYAYSITESDQYVIRVNDLFREDDPIFLELLGSEPITGIARSLAGENFLPVYDSLVVRNGGDEQEIRWHRDMGHDRSGRVCTVGVYLDASHRGDGALRVLPGTQSLPGDLCVFEDEVNEGKRRYVEIEMNPGDVLIHDVMVVHGSAPVREQLRRRTVYFEFRDEGLLRKQPNCSAEWVGLRRGLMDAAEMRADSDAADAPYSGEELDLIDRLSRTSNPIEPGHYCFRFGDMSDRKGQGV